MPIIVIIILSFFGGVGYAAKSALPGEALYPVKVSVEEPIEEALAFGTPAKSAVHVAHALERLHEIAALKALGKLDRRTQVFTKYAFETEVSKVNADIETLNNGKDFKDARSVEKTLKDGLKKSSALPELYTPLASPIEGTSKAEGSLGRVSPETSVVASTTIKQPTPTYTPKLLPPRNDIRFEDDGAENE